MKTPGRECLDVQHAVAYIAQDYPADEEAAIESHLDSCDQCGHAVAEMSLRLLAFPRDEWEAQKPAFVAQLGAKLTEEIRPATEQEVHSMPVGLRDLPADTPTRFQSGLVPKSAPTGGRQTAAATSTNSGRRSLVWKIPQYVGGIAALLCVTYGLLRFYRGETVMVPVTPKSGGAVNGNIYCELSNRPERVLVGKYALCPPDARIRVRAAAPSQRWHQVSFIHCGTDSKCRIAFSQELGGSSEIEFHPRIDENQLGVHSGWLVWSDAPLSNSAVELTSNVLHEAAKADAGVRDPAALCGRLGASCALCPFSWEVTVREP